MDASVTLISLLFSAIATWAMTETIHHGSIFETVRAYAEVSDSFFARLLRCPFCLSHWTALATVGLAELAFRSDDWAQVHSAATAAERVAFTILLWLVTVRLANLMNDATRTFNRTPKEGLVQGFEITEEDDDAVS